MKELLAQLCASFAPSGREEGVREVIRKMCIRDSG